MTMVSGAVQAVQVYLADGGNSPTDIDPTTGKGPEWGEAAPIGLLVIVLLCVSVYFLVKSMNRNLKKVPKSFGTEAAMVGATAAAAGATVATGARSPATAEAGGTTLPTAAEAGATESRGEAPDGHATSKADPPPSSATPSSGP